MKKKNLLIAAIVIILIIVIAVVIIACSPSKKTETEIESKPQSEQTTVNNNSNVSNNVGLNDAEKVFHPSTLGSYATIKIDSSIKMDDESAWLGLCPIGKDYITELEADEVDVIWFNADARIEENDPYVFACDFESVEDGKYALVVATSDDENVGYVVIQLAMEKNGEKLTFDFENAEVKERPAK